MQPNIRKFQYQILASVFIFGILLFHFPILTLVSKISETLLPYAMYVYVFSVWAFLILILAFLFEKTNIFGTKKQQKSPE